MDCKGILQYMDLEAYQAPSYLGFPSRYQLEDSEIDPCGRDGRTNTRTVLRVFSANQTHSPKARLLRETVREKMRGGGND